MLCITNNSVKQQLFIYTQLNVKTVIFQTIQFNISTQFSSVWPIEKTVSGATTPVQSGLGRNGNKGVLHIPKSSSIAWALPSDCLVTYTGHSLGEFYFSAGMQSVYSAASDDWVKDISNYMYCYADCNTICYISYFFFFLFFKLTETSDYLFVQILRKILRSEKPNSFVQNVNRVMLWVLIRLSLSQR